MKSVNKIVGIISLTITASIELVAINSIFHNGSVDVLLMFILVLSSVVLIPINLLNLYNYTKLVNGINMEQSANHPTTQEQKENKIIWICLIIVNALWFIPFFSGIS